MKRPGKKILKLAFINAYDRAREYASSMPPLGMGYLISYIKRECWFIEPVFCNTPEEVLEQKPDIVGISSASEVFNDAIDMARAIKEACGIPILLGGAHISGLPKFLPGVFDIGVIGEGEQTLAELLKAYYAADLSPAELSKIKGICYRENGAVRVTEQRPLLADLDQLPYPERDALRPEIWAVPFSEQVHMITSRGCPYTCTFCASEKIWRRYRQFSSDYVVEEIAYLRDKYDPEEIYFFDDLFIANQKRFKEICIKLKERALHRNIYFRSYARVDLVDEEMADLFEELHFTSIDFGFESNSARVLEYFNKKNASPDLNQRAIDLLKSRGISLGANFIVGAPVETSDDIRLTYEFIHHNIDALDRLSVGPLFPIPGTPIWDYARERGLVTEDDKMDWRRLIFYPDAFDLNYYPYLGEHVSKDEFADWMDKIERIMTQINLRGYIRHLQRRLSDKERRLHDSHKELMQLKGSRLIRFTNAMRNTLHTLGGGGKK